MKPKLITKNYLFVGFETPIDLKEPEWLGMSQVKEDLKTSLDLIENKTQPVRFFGIWMADPSADYTKPENHSKRVYFFGVEVSSVGTVVPNSTVKDLPECTFATFKENEHGSPKYEWLASSGYTPNREYQKKYMLDMEIVDNIDDEGDEWDLFIPIQIHKKDVVTSAFPVGTWPLTGTHDPALDELGIPDGAVIFGLFDDSYKKYDAPESIPGLKSVSPIGELTANTYCVISASSGFSYVIAMSDKTDLIIEMTIANNYEAGLALIEERCGNGKDNAISLATIAIEKDNSGQPRPSVRDVDAYYEDGVFYVVTYGKSNKMRQIEQNPEVALSVCAEWFSANGIGENLGWVLDPKNAEIRTKLRECFAAWYDTANNENDENCCILAIRLTSGTVIKDHGTIRYDMDFVNKTTV